MSSVPPGGTPKPRLVRPGSAKTSDPRDELLKKFSKNFRKVIENREQNSTPVHVGTSRSVKFNPETYDVSIGGTETTGHINMDTTTDTSSMSVSTCSSTSEQEVSVIEVPLEHRPKVITNGVPSSVPRLDANPSRDSPARKLLGSRFLRNQGMSTPVSGNRFLDKGLAATPDCYQGVDFETPSNRGLKHRRSSSSEMDTTTDEDGSSVTVAVRVRPFNSK